MVFKSASSNDETILCLQEERRERGDGRSDPEGGGSRGSRGARASYRLVATGRRRACRRGGRDVLLVTRARRPGHYLRAASGARLSPRGRRGGGEPRARRRVHARARDVVARHGIAGAGARRSGGADGG